MKFLALCALLVSVSSVCGQTNASFYVSTTGNDSDPGTEAAPWRTVQHAVDKARAGSIVNIREGVYEELVNINSSGNSSEGFITFKSYPGKQRSWMQRDSRPPAEAASSQFTTRAT